MIIAGFDVSIILFTVLKALIIFFVGRFVINIIVRQVQKIMSKKSIDPMLEGFALSILRFLLLFVLIMAILQTFGVQTTSLIAILGAASLAIGLALQGNLSNFASGVILVLFKPFNVGDYVEAGGTAGTIIEIGILQSILRTPDNKRIMVPNGAITQNNITNYNAYPERRVDLVVGVSYEADIEHVKRAITDVIITHEKILKEQPILVRMSAMAASSLDFNVRVWVKTEDYWDVYYDLNEMIKQKLDQENIEIPYPHMSVEMKK